MNCTIVSDGSELLLQCKNEHEKPYPEIKEKLREIIWTLYCEGYDTFYLNSEYGIPLWAAEAICAMKMYNDIKLNIVIPYEEQASYWCDEYRDRYFNVHAKSDSVIMADKRHCDDCYAEADDIMIAESDLLAVFGKKGNSLYAENCARKKNIKIMYFQ